MDFGTLAGLMIGLTAVGFILVDAQIINILLDEASLFFVVGGTFASTLMTYPWRVFVKIPTGFKLLLFPPKFIPAKAVVDRMQELAVLAHQQGIDALPDKMKATDMDFIKSGVRMLMDEWTVEDITIHLELDMQSTADRHSQIQRLFEAMATYAPVYGLLGTLIGVLGLLRFLGDPKGMGNAMAKAITTFYGIFFANFIALPVAGKLEVYTAHEMLLKRVVTEGIVCIKQEVDPITIKRKLEMILAQSARDKK